RLGMDVQPAFLEPDAERLPAPLEQQSLGLRQRHSLCRRIPPIREIPDPLLALTADDRDLAAHVEDTQQQTHLALAPPAVRLAARRLVILDLAREQRPPRLELAQHVAAVGRVLLQKGDQPAVERPVAPAHERLQERQVFGGPEERVPLDERPFLPQQAGEPRRGLPTPRPAPRYEGGPPPQHSEPVSPHGAAPPPQVD